MKITNLGKIKSLKLFHGITISNVLDSKYKNNLKDDCILIFSDKEEDFINIINSGIFKYTSFKYIYTFKSFNNGINSTISRVNLESYYKEVNSKLKQKRLYKKTISEYKSNNVIVDCTKVLEIFKKVSSKKIGNTKIEIFRNHIVNNILSKVNSSYKNFTIVIPVSGNLTQSENNLSKYLNLNSMKENDVVQFLYHLFKNEGYTNSLKEALKNIGIKDATFLFTNISSDTSFKFTLNELIEDKLKTKVLTKIKNIITIALKGLDDFDKKELDEEENTEEEDKELNKSSKVVENVVNSLITMVKTSGMKTPDNADEIVAKDFINNNGKLSTQEITLINNMIERAVDTQKELENNEIGLADGESEEDRLINKLQTDELFLKYLKELRDIETMGSSNINHKRKETLKTSQDNLDSTIKDESGKKLTIGSILNSNYDIEIQKKEILPKSNKEATIFENTKQNKTSEFDKAYMKNNYNQDILKTFSAFNNDEELPLFIESITKENTSDGMTLKETYTVVYRDTKNVKHKVVIDLPIIIDNKYIYVNGSKKLIQKQLITKPIIKTANDTVQLCSDYNKYFIKRFGQKLSEETEILRKILTTPDIEKYVNKDHSFKVKLGNISQSNMGSNVNIYYSFLSETVFSIKINSWVIEFDYAKLQNMTERENNTLYDTSLAELMENINRDLFHIVGYTEDKKQALIIDKKSNEVNVLTTYHVGNNKTTNDYYRVASNLNEWLMTQIKYTFNSEGIAFIASLSKPKALIYNRIKISGKQIPLIILLGYQYGLTHVLDRYEIPYVLTSKNKRPDIMRDMTMKIPFKNGNLYFDNKLVRNSLLLSGLLTMNTKEYEIDKFAKGGEPYLTYFQDNFGSRNVAKSLSNNMSLFLDPKTKDILKRLELPTNMLDIMLYANTLLESNDHHNNNYLGNYRLRGTEQVNAILYKILADSYRSYKDTSKNGNPIKVSVPQNILLKRLVENQTVDEASDLNPSLELEKASSVTWKGVGGVGSDDSFNGEFRAYDRSMVGILGMETPDSSKAGIVRTLSYNPSIINTLGFLDINSDTDGNANMYTIAEMLNPYTSLNADSPRISMQSQQQKHILAIEDTDKPLFGSGVEKTVPYLLSDVYTFKAKQDGVVEKIDKTNNVAILKYADGTKDVINLNEKINKNSAGGFYLNSNLNLLVNEGDTFNQGEILAKDNMYMVGDSKDNISYSTGALLKVAIAGSDATYEDSSYISDKISKRMKSKITMKKEMVLGVNTNIDFLVKKGQEVKTGDPLIIFESSFDDPSINEFLNRMGDEFGEMISTLTKNTYRSKYTGKIVDIRIYYNRDIEEFSPSAQKIIKDYIAKNEKLKNLLMKNSNVDSLNQINLPNTTKIDSPKIKGREVDGLVIEFFIEYEDYLGVGDKIAFYGSCKTIVSDVLDHDTEMTYHLDRYNEREVLDAVFSPLSLVSRMTTDISKALYTNKVILGLKENIRDMMNKL